MRYVIGILAFLALGLIGAYVVSDELRARLQAESGYRAYKGGRFDEAIAEYTSALNNIEDKRAVRRNLAMAHLARARELPAEEAVIHIDEVVSQLTAVIVDGVADSSLWELLLNTWVETGRVDEAQAFLEQRLEKDPSAENYRLLGWVKAQKSDFRGALLAYEKRAELLPNEANSFSSIAILTWEWMHQDGPTNDYEAKTFSKRGIEAALIAERLQPGHGSSLVYAGLLYRELAKRSKDPAEVAALTASAESTLVKARAGKGTP